jgi:hypothetical protein
MPPWSIHAIQFAPGTETAGEQKADTSAGRRLRLRDLLRVNPTSSLQMILATSIPIISWYMYINDVLLIVHACVRIDR